MNKLSQQQKVTEKRERSSLKKILLLLISLNLISCTKNDVLPSTLGSDISNKKYVEILENNLSTLPNNAQVAIALVHNGNTDYLGVTNQNNELIKTDNADKIFEIGSITKVFTSICLAEMVTSNEVSLTETLQSQFDFPLRTGGDITFQQLANHTSGLPVIPTNSNEIQNLNLEDPYAVYSYDNLKSYLQNHIILNATSGTKYEYSNLGAGILGYSLAKKRSSTFEELLQSTIFQPLRMHNTTTLIEQVDATKLVEPRDINGQVVSHWNFAETLSGGGSIKSSVTDMAKFIQKNFENDVVYNLPQVKTFKNEDNLHIGLGWYIYQDDEFTIYTHDGGTGGFSSMLMLDKNKKIGVIVLSNVEDYHNSISPLCNDFILEINN
ncbi:serine hydrolase domain-containing protein [Bernardetia sp. OM2101]|uniref:serine hydrolase domain-containing protein n=1 Tax=Bernardetia sp. OM2101 TaxID=3344876 RepID=UPI0035D05FA5